MRADCNDSGVAIPYPTKMRGEKHNTHTTRNLMIAGPGRDCCAAMAERDVDQKRQKRARLALSASLSPFNSISSMIEYLAFRMLVCMARSASVTWRDEAPLGIFMDWYSGVLDKIDLSMRRRADVPLLQFGSSFSASWSTLFMVDNNDDWVFIFREVRRESVVNGTLNGGKNPWTNALIPLWKHPNNSSNIALFIIVVCVLLQICSSTGSTTVELITTSSTTAG